MKHLQTYKIFEAKKAIELNTKQMAFLKKYVANISPGRWGWDVSYSTDPPIVNVFTSLNTSQYSLGKKINSMQGIHFGKIQKDFILDDIIISTYKGFPQEVVGDFRIRTGAKLNVPLRDFPEVKIGGNFLIGASSVESLEGCPEEVGSFQADNTKILDMVGCPKRYTNPDSGWKGNKIALMYNTRLVSLEGIPDDVELDKIGIIDTPSGVPGYRYSMISSEDLLDGLAEFRKIGSWIPYLIRIREKYTLDGAIGVNAYFDSLRMKEYLDSKITPEAVQEFIDLDPAKAAVALKGMWNQMKNDPKYSGIKFPSYSEEADLLGDLSDIGI